MKKTQYFLTNLLLLVLFMGSAKAELTLSGGLTKAIAVKTTLEKTIFGIITDLNGEPLVGVSVVVKGTGKGTLSDVNGNFKLNVERDNILVFSFVGFKTQEVKVTDTMTELNIKLEGGEALSTMTVVGSRFTKPRSDVDRPVPIDVITIKEIQQAGQVDLGQALQFSAPSFNAVKFGINDGAPFVDPATLRGLGPDQVLMLVNNKRRHKVSFLSINDGVGKGQVGTDINVVPALSLKRVEVLRDGAAAQYGSDAIAGVINMQLNNASSGGAVSAYYGQGYSKPNLDITGVKAPVLVQDGGTYNFSANVGMKLGAKGFLNATGTYSHTNGYDRSGTWTGNFYSSVKATNDSLLAARKPDLDRAILGAAENTTYGLFINAGLPINANWDFYTFGGYTKKHVVTGVFTRAPSNAARSVLAIFPDGYNPIAPADMQDLSITAGVKGKLGNDWALDISVGHGSNQVDWNAKNTVNPSLGATYNGKPAPTEFYVGQTYVNQTLINADITKSFNQGSYPNFSIAAGTEIRGERFRQIAGDSAAWQVGPVKGKDVGSSGREGFSPRTAVDKTRTNFGLYVEGESDITKQLLVGAAVRFENYTDFGAATLGKVNARYKIFDALAIRASASTGFRAPSMTQAYYSNYVNISFDNAGNSIFNPIISATSDLAKGIGITDGLKKETSVDFAGGLTSKIGENFTVTADVFQIDVDNRIMLSSTIATKGIAIFDAQNIPSTTVFVNAIDTRTKGFEFVANYNAKFGEKSKLALNAAFSSMVTTLRNTRTLTTPANKVIEVADLTATQYITDGQPKNKLILSANYKFGKLGFLVRATQFGKVTDPLATYNIDLNGDGKFANYTVGTVAYKEVDGAVQDAFSAKTLIDLSLSFNFTDKISLALGVNNITDQYPDLLKKAQTANEVVYSRRTNQFGTQGRFWNVTFNYAF
jgi:iron complex outermembrane recepter protein